MQDVLSDFATLALIHKQVRDAAKRIVAAGGSYDPKILDIAHSAIVVRMPHCCGNTCGRSPWTCPTCGKRWTWCIAVETMPQVEE